MEILRIQRQIHKNLHLNLSNNIKSYNIIYIWTIEIYYDWMTECLPSVDWRKTFSRQSPGFTLETCYDWLTEGLPSVDWRKTFSHSVTWICTGNVLRLKDWRITFSGKNFTFSRLFSTFNRFIVTFSRRKNTFSRWP